MSTTTPPHNAVPLRRGRQGAQAPNQIVAGTSVGLPDEAVLRQFLRLAGGETAVIAILSCAATNPAGTGEAFARRFRQLGAREADWLRIWQRWDANSHEVVTALRRATGIFIADGDRWRLSALLADTRAAETIVQRSGEGVAVAGVSADGSTFASDLADPKQRGAQSTMRRVDLAELGIGLGLLAEDQASQAIEWSGF